jgi:hypothetical protein
VKVQPHAEHQENDADLGELLCEVGVGDEARRERADDDPRQQVAHDGREAELLREQAEHECTGQASGEGQDQAQVVRHPELVAEPQRVVNKWPNGPSKPGGGGVAGRRSARPPLGQERPGAPRVGQVPGAPLVLCARIRSDWRQVGYRVGCCTMQCDRVRSQKTTLCARIARSRCRRSAQCGPG